MRWFPLLQPEMGCDGLAAVSCRPVVLVILAGQAGALEGHHGVDVVYALAVHHHGAAGARLCSTAFANQLEHALL